MRIQKTPQNFHRAFAIILKFVKLLNNLEYICLFNNFSSILDLQKPASGLWVGTILLASVYFTLNS